MRQPASGGRRRRGGRCPPRLTGGDRKTEALIAPYQIDWSQFQNVEYFSHWLTDTKGRILEVPLRKGKSDSAMIDYLTFTFGVETVYHLYRNRLHADAICGLHVPTTRQLSGRRTANILYRRRRRSSELDIRRHSLYRKHKNDKQTDSNPKESLKNAIPHNGKARQRQNAAHDVNVFEA